MSATMRIEAGLEAALAAAEGPGGAPPRLAAALRHAVFPGGARVRPHLCLAVAAACGAREPGLADAAAVAVELLHCASLAHDDLPCFDDAAVRRGRPSVHAAFGQPLAVLAGDALIVMAFEAVARAGALRPGRCAPLVAAIAQGVGPRGGVVAGQAWESEPFTPLEPYHQAKTGALFVAAACAGAIAAGADPSPWRALGERLGAAYQIADDLADAAPSAACGKPAGRDAALHRPSAVRALGSDGAFARLDLCVEQALAAVPPCRDARALKDLVRRQAARLAPGRPTLGRAALSAA
jgi:geranylgeranyl diphosphate synthase, type II